MEELSNNFRYFSWKFSIILLMQISDSREPEVIITFIKVHICHSIIYDYKQIINKRFMVYIVCLHIHIHEIAHIIPWYLFKWSLRIQLINHDYYKFLIDYFCMNRNMLARNSFTSKYLRIILIFLNVWSILRSF